MKTNLRTVLSLFILLLIIPLHSQGQHNVVLNMPHFDDANIHYGFILGVNQSFVTINPISDLRTRVFVSTEIPDILPTPDSARVLSISSNAVPGFVVGILANLRMGDYFDLRFIPSLAFGDRTLNYELETHTLFAGGDTIQRVQISKKVPSTYINFPLEIRFKAKRYNNFRPYLLAGAQYTLDLASNAKKREQKNQNEKIVKFNQNDVYAEAGVGFDFYNEWFKFGVELKMMFGLLDVLKQEGNIYTESIDKLNSKIFQISLSFE